MYFTEAAERLIGKTNIIIMFEYYNTYYSDWTRMRTVVVLSYGTAGRTDRRNASETKTNRKKNTYGTDRCDAGVVLYRVVYNIAQHNRTRPTRFPVITTNRRLGEPCTAVCGRSCRAIGGIGLWEGGKIRELVDGAVRAHVIHGPRYVPQPNVIFYLHTSRLITRRAVHVRSVFSKEILIADR